MGCYPRLATVNNAAMNIVQVSVHVLDFHSFWYICRSGIAGSYSNSIFKFWVVTTVFYIVDSCPRTVHKDSNFFTSLQPVPFWVFDCSTLVSMRCQVLLWKVHSDIWLLVGMISSLKFNVIFDMVGFKPAGLLFIFSLLSLFCAPLFLIFCLLDYLNIFLKNQFQLSVFYLYLRTLPWWLR